MATPSSLRAPHPAAPPVRRLWVLSLVLLLFASACTVGRNPISGNKRAYGYSWEQEKQLGAENDRLIVAQMGLYEDTDLARYVNEVGQRVLQESHLNRPDTPDEFRNTPFTFRVLSSPVVNAFALPGGYIYVTRGLLAHLENEAQLALVLGHEIVHVAGRHSSKRAATQQFQQLGLLGGAILAGTTLGGGAAEQVLNVGSAVSQLAQLSYGRDDERESDRLGVEYAALAGYEAGEGAGFFRSLDRLSQASGQSIPSWASSHPEPYEREKKIRELAAEWEQRVPMTKVDRMAYLRKLEGIILGENPREGFHENGWFYHPDLRFKFPVPRGYQVINQPTQVVMVPEDQGAVMGFTIAQDVRSARDAAAKLTNQEGIRVVQSGATRIDGNDAYSVVAEAQTQQGVLGVRVLFIEYGDNVYQFVGYTSAQAFNRYDDEFQRTMSGFSRLTDSRILSVQPSRLNLVTVRRDTRFRDLVPSTLPRGMTAQDLAILNQVELDETIAAGTTVKLPQ